eukprot:2111765-Alexandrium_andersonii.AAC.1
MAETPWREASPLRRRHGSVPAGPLPRRAAHPLWICMAGRPEQDWVASKSVRVPPEAVRRP